MVSWKNFDKLDSYGKLQAVKKVNLQEAMAGESGAERVKKYAVPMAAGLTYNFAAKAVDDAILGTLAELAEEQQLSLGKFQSSRCTGGYFQLQGFLFA